MAHIKRMNNYYTTVSIGYCYSIFEAEEIAGVQSTNDKLST